MASIPSTNAHVALLTHAGERGRTTTDKFGKRIVLNAPEVRERMELKRNENLNSEQVGRVFEKIEELAKDSPRSVRAKTGGKQDTKKLKIQFDGTEDE